jgi:WD repeat and SOF domain-containing protein 1
LIGFLLIFCRIFTVKFTPDARFLLTGSDDTNIRLWKANASEQLGVVPRRKQEYLNYAEALKKKYKDAVEINRIAKHRHLPKAVFHASNLKWVMKQADKRKLKNKIKHSKKGTINVKGDKERAIVKELE